MSRELIEKMNMAFADEWLAHYQYWLGAYVIEGSLRDEIIEELIEHSEDELRHAGMLAKRIIELGGHPLLSPQDWFKRTSCGYEPPEDPDQKVILEQNIDGERCAIEVYEGLADETKESDPISYALFVEILNDEIEHRDDLQALLKKLSDAN